VAKYHFPEKLGFLFKPARYKVLWGGRGGSKSWGIARALLLLGYKEKMRILCARETMQSISESVHKLLADQIDALKLTAQYEVQKSAILGKNGTEFAFCGLRHNIGQIKSFEAFDIAWVEEAQSVSKSSWEILIPTIRKENSEIWVSFNPELESDDTYQRFVVHPPTDVEGIHAEIRKVGWRDNPWFPDVLRAEMEHLKAVDEAAYNHIWEGMCVQTIEGAIYAKELAEVDKAQRITKVAYDHSKPVQTFWDIGDRYTSVWFAQAFPFEYRLIDYLEDEAVSLQHYMKRIQERPYVYSMHWMPHDATSPQLGTGKSIEEQMRGMGFPVRIVPRLTLEAGINAVRTIFPQCWFDSDKCADGLQGLRRYQWAPEGKLGQIKREPLHNLASHPSDAFRYFAVAIRTPRAPIPYVDRPKPFITAWS